jgi:hypothetical protein
MIGAYIFVRAIDIAAKPRTSDGVRAVFILLSVGLALVDTLCTLGLLASGTSTPGIR